jgi:hypothetical protein
MDPYCQLLVTSSCHLCHDAEVILMPFVEHGLLVEVIDIVDLEQGVERYGMRIPVLRHLKSSRELDWPFSYEHVAEFLVQA